VPHVDVRDLGRVRQISTVLARHGFGSALQALGLSTGPVEADGRPWAVRARLVLVELGPTFVKLGQVLSVRPDLVPAELMIELQKLQDQVPPAPWDEVQTLLEEELHAPLQDRFATFDETPIASASIAQVHLATLADGERVAVKVQRPGIADILRSDLHILTSLAHLAEGTLEVPGLYTPVAIVREFEQALKDELDFLAEADHCERFRLLFANEPRVVVPAVYRSLSTSRLLVMEAVDGAPLSTVTAADPRADEAVQILIEATFAQVFDHGFFHGDPHPGNLLLIDDGRLAWLDFGLCGTLTRQMQDTLVACFTALVFEDAETLALTVYGAGGTDGRVDLRAFRAEIERLMTKYHGASLSELGETASLVEFVAVAARYRIRLRPEFAVLARACSLVDGIARTLIPDDDIVERVKPQARRLAAERLQPDRVAADLLKLAAQTRGGLRELPTQLNQLMTDLQSGTLEVTTRDPDAELVRDALRDGVLRITLALCAMALLVSGSVLLAAWGPTFLGISVAGALGAGCLVAAVVLWVGLVTHTLLGEHLRFRALRRRFAGLVRFFVGDRRV